MSRYLLSILMLSAAGCMDGELTGWNLDTDADNDGWHTNGEGDEWDCDDDNEFLHPSAEEICDGLDNNCDGQIDEGTRTTLFADWDGDGYGDTTSAIFSCETSVPGYVSTSGDCEDRVASVNPDGVEVCDDLDNDCDGVVDEDIETLYYPDADIDGYGSSVAAPHIGCGAPDDYVADSSDCEDADATIYPDAPDACRDGLDQDCDGHDSWCNIEAWMTIPGSADLAVYGGDNDALTGTAVAMLGKISGDQTVAISAPYADTTASNNGAVYLAAFQGSPAGATTAPDPVTDLTFQTITGAEGGTKLGESLHTVADFGGNMALLIGAPYASVGNNSNGAAWLFRSATLASGEDLTTDQADLVLVGESYQDRAGTGLSEIGDWNGDGHTDLMITAPQLNESSRSNRGAIYRVAGCDNGMGTATCEAGTGGVLWGEQLPLADEPRLIGADAQDRLGSAVVWLPDFYGDGMDVIAVGAPGADAVYVLHASTPWSGSAINDVVDLTLVGPEDSEAGAALARISDVNGDEIDDLLVGAPGTSEVYVVLSGGRAPQTTEQLSSALVLTGPVGGEAGTSVADIGDVDGDGFSDVLIGAPAADGVNGETDTGRAYVAFGPLSSGTVMDDLVSTGTGSILGADVAKQGIGGAVAGGEDLDGDGHPDILIGASRWDVNSSSGNDAGAAFVLYGGVER